jgi:hypothetical protein
VEASEQRLHELQQRVQEAEAQMEATLGLLGTLHAAQAAAGAADARALAKAEAGAEWQRPCPAFAAGTVLGSLLRG